MEKHDIEMHIHALERERMRYTSVKYLPQFVSNTSEIIEERRILSSAPFDNASVHHVARIVVVALRASLKFRRVDCLKILSRMIRNRSEQDRFGSELVDDLFYLYSGSIIGGSEEIESAVGVYLTDQILSDEHIQWLIDNYEQSEHVVNLLLGYPEHHPLVTEWARRMLDKGKLSDRIAELIGILIVGDLPEDVQADNSTFMWAIYYSRLSKPRKKKLILKHVDYESYASALEVAGRLDIGGVSKALLKHYRELLEQAEAVETPSEATE